MLSSPTMKTVDERGQAARELLEAERDFQAVQRELSSRSTALAYAAARARLERAGQRVEALLVHDSDTSKVRARAMP